MFDETKKSVESILSQRLTSPFYGTLIISWLIWNWKIIYLTIFISDDKITGNKIEYIVANYNDVNHIVWFPLISTVVLLVFVPFLTYWAYWLELIFNKLRLDKKNTVESKQLLSIEQSINLREQIVNMENRFTTLLSDKESEISQLKSLLNEKSSQNTSVLDNEEEGFFDSEIENIVKKNKSNDSLYAGYKLLEKYILNVYSGISDKVSHEVLSYFVSNDLIENIDSDIYKWTIKGKEVYKILINDSFK